MSEKMTTSEPTTGEIVRALREEARIELGGKAAMIHLSTVQNAIDRLESQERRIAELTETLYSEVADEFIILFNEYAIEQDYKLSESAIRLKKALISAAEKAGFVPLSRAESAERERDAADNDSYDLYKRFESISDEVREESPSCKLCENFPEKCSFCSKYSAFELRGLRRTTTK